MAVTTTPRFGFKKYGAGTDPYPTRAEFNALMDLHENNAAMYAQGATNARPAGGKRGRFYWDTDVARLYYDNGASWEEVTTNGGGGAGKPITPATAGVEGISARSARADHTHNLPLATASADGAMPASDKALLNTASATATPGSIVKLDGSGRSQVAAPAAAADVANKGYVDAGLGEKANAAHQHSADDVTTGTFAPARLPAATAAAQGALSAADKAKLDAAVAVATAGALVARDAAGRAQFAAPAALADAATKGYVDDGLAGKSNTGHTHSFGSLTGIPATFAPSAHRHPWGDLDGVPATFAPSAHTHSADDVTSGTLNAARLPAASSASAGSMSAADKSKLDGATDLPTASKLVLRDAAGRAEFADPAALSDAATKGYVDSGLNTKAPTNHSHDWASITGKPAGYQPNAHTHGSTDIIMGSGQNLQQDYNTHGAYIDDLANRISQRLTTASFLDRIEAGPTNRTGVHPPDWSAALYVGAGRVWSTQFYNYNVAYGSYRAAWVNSDGSLGYNLSSRKYKTDERDYTLPLSLLSEITPKRFKYKTDVAELGAEAPDRVNFIAEDLFDAGLKEFVSFDDGGTERENVETINEQLMVSALWSFAKQQQELIEGMRRELDELKAGR